MTFSRAKENKAPGPAICSNAGPGSAAPRGGRGAGLRDDSPSERFPFGCLDRETMPGLIYPWTVLTFARLRNLVVRPEPFSGSSLVSYGL